MPFRVEIAPRALADIEAAFLFIKAEAPTRADTWLQDIIAAIYSLEELPFRCATAPESRSLGEEVRELLYGKKGGVYRILFSVKHDTVRVLHVRHGARCGLEMDELEELLEEGKESRR